MSRGTEELGIRPPRPDKSLTDAIEKQTKVLEGLAVMLLKFTSPPIISAGIKINGDALKPGGITQIEPTPSTREIELEAALKEANGIIRSFSQVCSRDGAATNWDALKRQVARILAEQHRLMYPEQYTMPPAPPPLRQVSNTDI